MGAENQSVKPLDFPLLADENIAPDVYLRPGHISAEFVLAVIDALRASTVEVQPPFIAVAERQQSAVRVRVRTAPPW